ncbi:MAG: phospholipase A1 [Paraglaciecola sp.]|jgi:phospholipase A1
MGYSLNLTLCLAALSLTHGVYGQDAKDLEVANACMAEAVKTAMPEQTVGELREQCSPAEKTAFGKRFALEQQASANPFAILPHKPNYVLPVTYSESNFAPYDGVLQGIEFDDVEAKFQVSLKYVAVENFFFHDLDVQFAFTATSWWQSYNSAISAPFRETNYEPELIFNYHNPWSLFGIPVGNTYLSLNHQSNGQSGALSRSWNRLIGGIAFNVGDVAWGIRSWYRFPESEKTELGSPRGDDNPDIEKYLGYGELGALWQVTAGHNLEIMLRNNLRSDNKGAIQLGWSFPLSKHLRGYIEYFNGYGESLIYYDHAIERLGIGVKLTDWL